MQWIALGVLTAFCLLLSGALAALAIAAARVQIRLALLTPAVLILLMCAVLGVYIVRTSRLAMEVTTEGIHVRNIARDRWIPWDRIARVQETPHWYYRRRTCIVMKDGSQVHPTIATFPSIILRGEPFDEPVRSGRAHMVPTQQAIAAHQRWLRSAAR